MTQEEKDLVLRDLCGRLPYGVIMTNIELPETHYPLTCEDLHDAMFDDDWNDVPYLRPMSSMTAEEKEQWLWLTNDSGWGMTERMVKECIDFLNKKMFDYRGLIPRSCAIAVTEDNNPYID